jgi:hypothetical protein
MASLGISTNLLRNGQWLLNKAIMLRPARIKVASIKMRTQGTSTRPFARTSLVKTPKSDEDEETVHTSIGGIGLGLPISRGDNSEQDAGADEATEQWLQRDKGPDAFDNLSIASIDSSSTFTPNGMPRDVRDGSFDEHPISNDELLDIWGRGTPEPIEVVLKNGTRALRAQRKSHRRKASEEPGDAEVAEQDNKIAAHQQPLKLTKAVKEQLDEIMSILHTLTDKAGVGHSRRRGIKPKTSQHSGDTITGESTSAAQLGKKAKEGVEKNNQSKRAKTPKPAKRKGAKPSRYGKQAVG